MTPKLDKRLWVETSVEGREGGFTVLLDKRPLRTPARAPLIVPSRAFAEGIAAEWDAVTGKIKPAEMPLTRSANAAIDKLAIQRDAVIAMLAEYGDTDLLCYRAEMPAELVDEQAQRWDPILHWAGEELSVALNVYSGIVPRPQPAASLKILKNQLTQLGDFELAAMHDLITISGSLVLALAVQHNIIAADAAFDLSRLDADWQARLWGADDEAEIMAAAHRRDFVAAAHMLALLH